MRDSNSMQMKPNGKFVIMQVSDPQDLVFVRPAMIKMLEDAYTKIQPDLVVFTGDNILGNHLLDARVGSRKVASGHQATYQRMCAALAHILEPLEERRIPFAMIFGNHDDMNLVTKKEQADIFRSYSCCLPLNTTNPELDEDTYNIPILSSDGSKTAFNLWMLDTAWYDKMRDKCFEEIKESAVNWYRNTESDLRKNNGGVPVASLLFMHIPFAQQRLLCRECAPFESGALKLPDGRYICLDDTKATGIMGEPPCICGDPYGMFEAIKERGDVMAAVSGHDHQNCFDGTVEGVRLVQTSCASFRCYGNEARGVRVFVLDENKPDSFETKMYTYADICGTGLTARLRYAWDADELQVKKFKILGACGAALAGTAAAVTIKLTRK